jgi:Protein of unknown function (DUF3995)
LIHARANWATYCATLWCAAFAAVHLFWAVGGSVGLASSAGHDLAARRPTTFVAFGLYGVALMLVLAATFLGVANRVRLGRYRGVVVGLVGLVGVVLLLRGVVLEVLLAADVAGLRTQVGPLEAHWSQMLWNPWFAVGGALFIAAALRLRRR